MANKKKKPASKPKKKTTKAAGSAPRVDLQAKMLRKLKKDVDIQSAQIFTGTGRCPYPDGESNDNVQMFNFHESFPIERLADANNEVACLVRPDPFNTIVSTGATVLDQETSLGDHFTSRDISTTATENISAMASNTTGTWAATNGHDINNWPEPLPNDEFRSQCSPLFDKTTNDGRYTLFPKTVGDGNLSVYNLPTGALVQARLEWARGASGVTMSVVDYDNQATERHYIALTNDSYSTVTTTAPGRFYIAFKNSTANEVTMEDLHVKVTLPNGTALSNYHGVMPAVTYNGAFLGNATNYRVTAMRVWVQCTNSSLENGGNVGMAFIPDGTGNTVFQDPDDVISFVAEQSRDCHVGPWARGAFGWMRPGPHNRRFQPLGYFDPDTCRFIVAITDRGGGAGVPPKGFIHVAMMVETHLWNSIELRPQPRSFQPQVIHCLQERLRMIPTCVTENDTHAQKLWAWVKGGAESVLTAAGEIISNPAVQRGLATAATSAATMLLAL